MAGSWLTTHLETFVKPVLGFVPEKPSTRFFHPDEMTAIKAMWRSAKRSAKGNKILLAGRDVFVFEILARRENYPTTFRPDISRATVEHVKEDYSRHFIFDTGFAGSIPRLLNSKFFVMASALNTREQVFPKMKNSRAVALLIERTPKYWKRAYFKRPGDVKPWEYFVMSVFDNNAKDQPGDIVQELSTVEEFKAAAQLTIEVYTDSSPAFKEVLTLGRHADKDMWL